MGLAIQRCRRRGRTRWSESVRRRMGIGEEERGGDTNHVSHMVWRVKVYAIPTSIVYQSIHTLNEGA